MARKESFLNLILIFLSLGFGFVFVEVILRVFDPYGVSFELADHPRNMYSSSKTLGWKLTPAQTIKYKRLEYNITIKTDSRGFRVPLDFKTEMKPAEPIAIIGDSFVLGVGVQAKDTFSELTANRLNSKNPRSVFNLLNMGLNAYGLAHYPILVRQAKLLNPIAIVVVIYANDFQDGFRDIDGFGFSVNPQGILVNINWKDFLFKKIGFLQWPSPFSLEPFLALNSYCYGVANMFFRGIQNVDLTKELKIDLLEHLFNELRSAKVNFMFLTIPPPPFFRNEKFLNQNQLIKEFASKRNIAHLYLWSEMNKKKYYFLIDGHLTESGHDFVSKNLVMYLAKSFKL